MKKYSHGGGRRGGLQPGAPLPEGLDQAPHILYDILYSITYYIILSMFLYVVLHIFHLFHDILHPPILCYINITLLILQHIILHHS